MCDLFAAWDRHSAYFARALGIRPIDAAALLHLAAGALTPTQLGERLGSGSGSLTGIIDRLAAAGFVTRRPHPSDRRSVIIELTVDGRARARDPLDGLIAEAGRAAARRSADERRLLVEFFGELTHIIQREAPVPAG